MIKGYLAIAGLFRVPNKDCRKPANAVRNQVKIACSKFGLALRRSFELMGQVPLQ